MTRALSVTLAIAVLSFRAGAAVVTERWGVKGFVQHPNTLAVQPAGGGGSQMAFDLSALPGGTKVHRARLLIPVPGRYHTRFEIVPASAGGTAGKPTLQPAGKPLPVVPPHCRWFDATEAVRGWVKAKTGKGLLWLKQAPRFDQGSAVLEIAFDGELKSPPKPVSDVKAFCRAGQVFITFKEIADPTGGKDQVTCEELSKLYGKFRVSGPVPSDKDRELRYRVYRHDGPITPESIGQAALVGEVAPGTGYNPRASIAVDSRGNRSIGSFSTRKGYLAVRQAVEPGKPLPPGTGLYVHTVEKKGKAWYAVITAVNGVENTADLSGCVGGPVEQAPGDPRPVLQFTEVTKLRREGEYHERRYTFWCAPPLTWRPMAYDFSVGLCPGKLAKPAGLTVTRGHTWGPSSEMPRPAARSGLVMSMTSDDVNGFWTGTNSARDTLLGIGEGTWRPFTHNRQEAIIRWMMKTWKVDEQRIVGAIGAWGMWEMKRGDLYCHIHGWGMPELTKGFQCWDWARGTWGRPEHYAGKPDQGNPWVQQDYTRWVLENPAKELPYFRLHTGWGAHFTEMGWPPFPRFVRAMIDTRRAFCMQSQAVGQAMSQGIITIRRDRSLPAFGNCSLDDNIGEGDLRSGKAFGQINGYLVWESETIVDEPDRYEVTVFLWKGDSRGRGGAPLDACTVDLTPRKCRKFKPKPGERLAWTNALLPEAAPEKPPKAKAEAKQDAPAKAAPAPRVVQSGAATADKHGLATLRKLNVTKGRHRIVIKRL